MRIRFAVLEKKGKWRQVSSSDARKLFDEGEEIRLKISGIKQIETELKERAAYIKRMKTRIRIIIDYWLSETFDPIMRTFYRRNWARAIQIAKNSIISGKRPKIRYPQEAMRDEKGLCGRCQS